MECDYIGNHSAQGAHNVCPLSHAVFAVSHAAAMERHGGCAAERRGSAIPCAECAVCVARCAVPDLFCAECSDGFFLVDVGRVDHIHAVVAVRIGGRSSAGVRGGSRGGGEGRHHLGNLARGRFATHHEDTRRRGGREQARTARSADAQKGSSAAREAEDLHRAGMERELGRLDDARRTGVLRFQVQARHGDGALSRA